MSIELADDDTAATQLAGGLRIEGMRPPADTVLEPTRWFEWAWTAQYAAEGRTHVAEAVPPEATWSRPLFAPKLATET